MKSNLPQHPCKGKCTAFKEEQCNTCLIAVNADFTYGDMVVKTHGDDNTLYEFSRLNRVDPSKGYIHQPRKPFSMQCFALSGLKHATTAELKAGHRLPAPEMQRVVS